MGGLLKRHFLSNGAGGSPVSLANLKEIKADSALAKILLVTHSRLSVMPIPKPAFDRIVASGGKKT